MAESENASPAGAIRRKLRAITAVLVDPAATGPERANAERLKVRLEKQLAEEAAPEAKPEVKPEGKWTAMMFRLGRGVKEMGSPPARKGDWMDRAFRLGRLFRKGFKR